MPLRLEDNDTHNKDTKSPLDGGEQDEPSVERFEDVHGLDDDLLRGVFAAGYENPSEFQKRGIAPIIAGRDVVGQSQSGTGKTATFAIGCLARIDIGLRAPQCVLLSPTRELARQTSACVTTLATYMPDLVVGSFVGGAGLRDNLRALRTGVHICVGTPGRVKHMIADGALQTRHVKIFCLDECDELLDFGFQDSIREIFQVMPDDVQVLCFSATLPPACVDLTAKFTRNPVKLLLAADQVPLAGIAQFYIALEEQYKLDTLCDLYEGVDVSACIIFVNGRRKVEWLAQSLASRDFSVSAIHGELEEAERRLVIREFKQGASRVLISTDLLARGLDVQQVSLVINFDVPGDPESYIHRIGRCGRFGRKGVAINLVTGRDVRAMRAIEELYGTDIGELPADLSVLGAGKQNAL